MYQYKTKYKQDELWKLVIFIKKNKICDLKFADLCIILSIAFNEMLYSWRYSKTRPIRLKCWMNGGSLNRCHLIVVSQFFFFLSYLNFTCLRWPLTFWEFRLASTFDSFLNDWQFWNQLILQRLFYLVWLRVTKTHKEHRLMHATWKYNLPWVPLQNSVLNIHNLCLQLLLTLLLILSPFSERHHWNDLCQAQ